jgi:hypothetical protein
MKHQFAITTLLVSSLCAPLASVAHEAVDPLHATPIETVESRLASPKEVHVQEGEKGVEVKGVLQRRGHSSIKLRGHVDVELLDANGQVMNRAAADLSFRSGSSEHDHSRRFSVLLPKPSEAYTVRVVHSLDEADHQ